MVFNYEEMHGAMTHNSVEMVEPAACMEMRGLMA